MIFNKENMFSLIVQGILSLLIAGTMIYLAITGKPVPEILSASLTLILGFWFGNEVGQRMNKE